MLGLILPSTYTYAQQQQWATELIDFSSELSAYEYAAQQVLGEPNVLPNAGDNPNAWMPRRSNRIDFIKVGFENPIRVQQVAIAESFNPGAISQLYFYDTNGQEYLINIFSPRPLPVGGRLLNVYINETDYEVTAVKVVIDGSKVSGYNAIDAVGISGSKIPLIATQKLAIIRTPVLRGDKLSLRATGKISDTHPVFVKKFNSLFFTRAFHPDNIGGQEDPGDIWTTTVTPDGIMEEPVPLGDVINNYGLSSSNGYYSIDGRDMFLFSNVTGRVNRSQSNVVLTIKNDNTWEDTKVQKIKNNFIVSFSADYTLAAKGRVLIISTLRYDTQGGRDLFICHRDGENNWTEPINMGKKINTANDEYSPFYAESESALYFSTAGFAGFGKGDIYRILRTDSTWNNWSDPINLGPEINTPFDEKYYNFDEMDDYVYFARNDEDSVYHIIRMNRPSISEPTPMVVLRGSVFESTTNQPVASELSVALIPEGKSMGVALSDEGSGQYEMMIPSGFEYTISILEEEYEPYTKTIFLENRNEQYVQEYNIPLTTMPMVAKESEVMVTEEVTAVEEPELGDVLFDFDKDIPKDYTIPSIDKVIAFLIKNNEFKVELAGYTDHIGNLNYNQRLSQRRAAQVKKYMISKGIEPERITAKGFGEEIPELMTYDKVKLQRYRRVEFNLTK